MTLEHPDTHPPAQRPPEPRRWAGLVLIACTALFTAACTTQQKVDRVHASIYHQQANIQKLEQDLEEIAAEREQIRQDIEVLHADTEENAEKIRQTSLELIELDEQQSALNAKIRNVNQGVNINDKSIAEIEINEEKRKAIIKAQQERWQQITSQTNNKLADLDQAPISDDLETEESESSNGKR